MLGVIFKLIVMRPQMLLTHATHYAELFRQELQDAIAAWKLLLLFYALSVICFGAGLTTAAGAILLWSALPLLNPQTAWVLAALPLALLVSSGLFYVAAMRYRALTCFDGVQEQLKLDMLALCQAQNP